MSEQTATILGSKQQYALSPLVKRYTLRDTGFMETKNGSFVYERPIDPLSGAKQGFKLKINVNKEINTLKMSIVSANGLKAINLYSKPDYEENISQFEFLISDLIKRNVLVEAE